MEASKAWSGIQIFSLLFLNVQNLFSTKLIGMVTNKLIIGPIISGIPQRLIQKIKSRLFEAVKYSVSMGMKPSR